MNELFNRDLSLRTDLVETDITRIILTAKAKRTRADKRMGHVVGDIIDVYAGEVRGMSDNGQPGWSEFSPTHFSTIEEAQNINRNLAGGWDFEVILGTTKIVTMTCKMVTRIENFSRTEMNF